MSKTRNGVWVLTTKYNEYNQNGEYLCCVWADKPSTEQLAEFFRYKSGSPGNVMDALHFLLHLGKGGGRREREHQWYNLTFVEFGKDFHAEEN